MNKKIKEIAKIFSVHGDIVGLENNINSLITEEVEKRIKVMARRTGKTMSTLELMTDTPIREIDEAIAQERAEILEEIKDICGFYDYTDEYNTASDIEEKIETYLNHKGECEHRHFSCFPDADYATCMDCGKKVARLRLKKAR